MNFKGEFNDVYASFFGKDFPARLTVGVELVSVALVEISVIPYRELTLSFRAISERFPN